MEIKLNEKYEFKLFGWLIHVYPECRLINFSKKYKGAMIVHYQLNKKGFYNLKNGGE